MASLAERIEARRQELAGGQSGPTTAERIARRREELTGEVVFRTPDGQGRVVRDQAGQLSFTSPGYSTTDPAKIEEIMGGASVKDTVQKGFDEQVLAQHPYAARATEFLQGAPFVGEWIDEGVAATGTDIGKNIAQGMNVASGVMERQNPYESVGWNMAGGVTLAAPLAGTDKAAKVAEWIGRGSGLVGQGLRAAVPALSFGATEGALSFSGRAEPGERGRAAKTGAVIGGGLSLALTPLAAALGVGVDRLAGRVKSLDVKTIMDTFGIDRRTAVYVKRSIANDDLDAAVKYLQRNPDALLAEAGPATRQTLDTAMATGGAPLSIGRARVGERVEAAGTRFKTRLNELLGTAEGGIKTARRGIAQKTAASRKAAYDFAYSQPTPMVGEAASKIGDVLRRIDDKTLRAALEEASAEMRFDGYVNQNILARVADDGTVSFEQPLSVLELDYIARGLGNVADAATDKVTGQVSRAGQRAMDLAGQLRDALKESVQGYRAALKLGGDKIQQTNALIMGRKLLNPSTTVEDVRLAFKEAAPDVRAAAKKGLRENIEAVMDRARMTIEALENAGGDLGADANAVAEAVAAFRNLSQSGNRKKVLAVMGRDGKALMDELQRVGDALILKASVARGSATAIRTSGKEALADVTQPGLLRRTAGGSLDVTQEPRAIMAGTDRATVRAEQERIFEQVADALTRIRGPEAQRALAAVRNAMAGQPLRDADAALIGRLTGFSVVTGGNQTGPQVLSTP